MSPEKKATLASSSVAATLAITKLIIGLISGSVAVLASAIDSLLDLGASLFNYFAVLSSEKPADETFNYGRGKIEGLAAFIEGVIIACSGLYIIFVSVEKYTTGEHPHEVDIGIAVMILSLIATLGLVTYLSRVARQTGSLVIKSDTLHYKTDVISNSGILISLFVIEFTGFAEIDSLIGFVIGLYIFYSAYELVKEGTLMLLDRALEDSEVTEINNIVCSTPNVSSYHFLKTRKSGQRKFVECHLVFNPEIMLIHAHKASDDIENAIRELDSKSEWIFNMHLDVEDDSDRERANSCQIN